MSLFWVKLNRKVCLRPIDTEEKLTSRPRQKAFASFICESTQAWWMKSKEILRRRRVAIQSFGPTRAIIIEDGAEQCQKTHQTRFWCAIWIEQVLLWERIRLDEPRALKTNHLTGKYIRTSNLEVRMFARINQLRILPAVVVDLKRLEADGCQLRPVSWSAV